MNPELFLSTTDSTPMYRQLIDQITAKVLAGDWPAGQGLPSIRELAAGSRVSVITVKRAYLELERAGVIVTRPGKGSFVATSQDLPRALLRADFERQFDALLLSATMLGLSREALVERLDAAVAEGRLQASSTDSSASVAETDAGTVR